MKHTFFSYITEVLCVLQYFSFQLNVGLVTEEKNIACVHTSYIGTQYKLA